MTIYSTLSAFLMVGALIGCSSAGGGSPYSGIISVNSINNSSDGGVGLSNVHISDSNDNYKNHLYVLLRDVSSKTSLNDLERVFETEFSKEKEKKWSENSSDMVYGAVVNDGNPYRVSYFESLESGVVKKTSISVRFLSRQLKPSCLSLSGAVKVAEQIGWERFSPFLAQEMHGVTAYRRGLKLTIFADVGGGEGVPSDYNKGIIGDTEGCVTGFDIG